MNTIKKMCFVFILAGLSLAGCKKDEDQDQTPAAKIAGNYLVNDTVFYANPPSGGCGSTTDMISSFGLVITKLTDNSVTVSGLKCPEDATANVTNTSLVISAELCAIYHITGSISGNTIMFQYDYGAGGSCYLHGRATATKQE